MGSPVSVPHTFTLEADGAITKYQACVCNAEGKADPSDADNDANFIGVAQESVADGDPVTLSADGSLTKVLATGTSVSVGDYLVTNGSSGNEGEVISASNPTTATQNIVGQAIQATGTTHQEIVMVQRVYRDFDQTA